MSEFSAELIGTMLVILLGTGVVANVILQDTKGNNSGWMVITTGWALAVFVGVVVAGPISGAHLNPAVTIALAIVGKFPWEKAPMFMLAQLLGSMLGAFLTWVVYREHFNKTADPETQLAVFSTTPAIRSKLFNLVSEIVGTFVLIFVIFYIAGGEMGPDKTPVGLGSVGALPVAFLVWAIGLSLGGTTGYAINPFRDLGPRIMHSILPMSGKGTSNWKYAWIPILGPVIGASIAALVFMFFQQAVT